MSSGEGTVRNPDDGELLPDEEAMIVERLDELEDPESHLTTEEVAQQMA